jgi:hypothetical protein
MTKLVKPVFKVVAIPGISASLDVVLRLTRTAKRSNCREDSRSFPDRLRQRAWRKAGSPKDFVYSI